MNISVEQLLMIGTGAASIITALAGVVYRDLKSQIAECKAENATLRAEAKEMVKAKDAEKDEWKRLAMERPR